MHIFNEIHQGSEVNQGNRENYEYFHTFAGQSSQKKGETPTPQIQPQIKLKLEDQQYLPADQLYNHSDTRLEASNRDLEPLHSYQI